MDNAQRVRGLREQLSHLSNLLTLSMVMSDGRDERQILALAVSSVASLTSCRPVASLLTTGSDLRAPDGRVLDWPEPTTRLKELDGADGRVATTRSAWARAYALRAVGGHAGYLVVGADTAPSKDKLFLLRVLTQQTGRALATAALHRRDRETVGRVAHPERQAGGDQRPACGERHRSGTPQEDPRDAHRRRGSRDR
jgi:hypothetical protein